MNILITGINGFVGSNLLASLCEKHTVFGLDIIQKEKQGVSHTYSWKDLEDNKIPSMDVIIHLAGKAHDTNNKDQRSIYFKINTGLTQKIFDYFLSSNAEKFIFFSSIKAAADAVIGEVLTEKVTPSPKGPYGESKMAAERYILSHFNMNIESKKRVYILRPCMIHGPGNKGNLNLLYSVVKSGMPWPLGKFENRRSFTSIDNVSFVIRGLLDQKIPSGIYHMGDDDALSTNELIEVMCQTMGHKTNIWHLPKRLMFGAAKLGDLMHLPLNSLRLRKLTENYVVSNAKIKEALGIKKMPVSSREGLIITLKSFRNRKTYKNVTKKRKRGIKHFFSF